MRRDRSRSPALPSRSHDRSRSGRRLPGSPARLRAEEPGRLARRETQEGVEAVASQTHVVSEAAAGVTPTRKGNALQALFPLLSRPLPARKLLREFRALGLLLLPAL